MTKCDLCGKDIPLAFVCNFCRRSHCAYHRPPEAHSCSGFAQSSAPIYTSYPRSRTVFSSMILSRFRQSELQQLLIAWLVLGFCFSANALFNSTTFLTMFAVSLLTLGFGFVGHELAHRYLARRYGCWAEFRLWGLGLLMALVFALISGGRMIFAAPGAVYIVPRTSGFGYGISKKQNGLISLSGPLANIIIAIAFFFVANSSGMLGLIASTGFRVNLWLAAFNLLPFGMLDGRKVFAWSHAIWAAITIPAWLMVFLL